MLVAVTSDATGQNLATLGLIMTDQLHILEVNVENLVLAQTAHLLANNLATATTRFHGLHLNSYLMFAFPQYFAET